MKIDALKVEVVFAERVQSWAVATIEKIEQGKLFCEFDGINDYTSKETFDINSSRIAPYNFRTAGWEWRDQIKENERMDILDNQGKWFLGTVLQKREFIMKEQKFQECYVCYRIYTEDGSKTDNKGRRHEGWSEQYDCWIPAYSIKIQK